ncbi:unnamed protein product [Trichobilharzia regenti]|nr:unnamed protein product [Trichobilharzia regenti]
MNDNNSSNNKASSANAPGVEDANVWGLVSLKKGDKKAPRKILNDFHKNNDVLNESNEVQDAMQTRSISKDKPDKASKMVSKMLLEKIAMRERERFLLARVAARNKRQNKIKSKRFHRHLKGRTMKEYENETESLRLMNPKEFAKRLARAAVADMHELSREVTRRPDPHMLSDTDESDVSISSESEGESEESDFNLDDDNEDDSGVNGNVNGVIQTFGWWKKGSAKNKPNDTFRPTVGGALLSTEAAEKVLEKSEVNQIVLTEPSVCNTDTMVEESDVVDPNSEGFFHALQESFANDPALQQKFLAEKTETAKSEAPQDIDTYLPGWNSWTGPGTEAADERRRKARIIPAPKVKREDDKKSHVIIKRRLNQDFKQHLVKSIPFPYSTPEQFEAFVSQPICREWITESSHRELTRPKVTVQSGRIIRPISKSAALLRDMDIERFTKQKPIV